MPYDFTPFIRSADQISNNVIPQSKLVDGTLDLGGAKVKDDSLISGKVKDGTLLAKDTQYLFGRFRGVSWFNNNWLPSGMVYSSVSGSGIVVWSHAYVCLSTGITTDSIVYLVKHSTGLTSAATWDKPRYLGFRCYIDQNTAQTIWLVSGNPDLTFRRIGFKIVDGTLYGTVSDGTTIATLSLTTFGITTWFTLECIFKPGVECRFYVDGVDKGALTTNLPSGTEMAEVMMRPHITNTAGVNREISIYEWRCFQEE